MRIASQDKPNKKQAEFYKNDQVQGTASHQQNTRPSTYKTTDIDYELFLSLQTEPYQSEAIILPGVLDNGGSRCCNCNSKL